MDFTKQEVEDSIKGKDDFIKIDYLNRYLKKADTLDMKKFLLLNLAAVNEQKNMLQDAVKNVSRAGDIALTYREKRELHMKEADLWIRIGDFNMADRTIVRAYGYGNNQEKEEMEHNYHQFYFAQGHLAEKTGNYRKAIEIYQKLFSILKLIDKKEGVRGKLVDLYNQLGRIRDAERIKRIQF